MARRFTQVAALIGLTLVAVPMASILGGCRNDRSVYADAFAPNRLRTLERSVLSLQEACKVASTEIEKGTRDMVALFDESDREEAFIGGRRIAARARGRLTSLDNRIRNVENNAMELLEEWARETRSFKDKDLRARSRADLADLKARWEPLRRMLGDMRASYKPVMIVIEDDVLALKHRRSALAPALPAPLPSRYEATTAEMLRWAQLCDAACNEFTAMLPQGDTGTVSGDATPVQ